MTFSDKTSPVSSSPQQFDKGDVFGGERRPVKPDPCVGWHPPSHERRPVGHADRTGGVETIECQTRLGQAINIWRSHYRVAIASQMICFVLVRYDEQKVRFIGHTQYSQKMADFLCYIFPEYFG